MAFYSKLVLPLFIANSYFSVGFTFYETYKNIDRSDIWTRESWKTTEDKKIKSGKHFKNNQNRIYLLKSRHLEHLDRNYSLIPNNGIHFIWIYLYSLSRQREPSVKMQRSRRNAQFSRRCEWLNASNWNMYILVVQQCNR